MFLHASKNASYDCTCFYNNNIIIKFISFEYMLLALDWPSLMYADIVLGKNIYVCMQVTNTDKNFLNRQNW